MTDEPKEKVAEEKPAPPKPPGYREFERLLKLVVKAPPLPSRKSQIG